MNGKNADPTATEGTEHNYRTDLADFRGFYPDGCKPATVRLPETETEIEVVQIDLHDGELGLHVALSEYKGHNFEFVDARDAHTLFIPNGDLFDVRLSSVHFEHEMVTLWYEVVSE